jgi:hypothetical protein
MNKKTKIQVAIIAVMFISSGVVLYMGFHSSAPPPSPLSLVSGLPAVSSVASDGSPDVLLPYGSEYDFKGVDPSRFTYDMSKITVSPDEVGVTVDDLVKSTSTNP